MTTVTAAAPVPAPSVRDTGKPVAWWGVVCLIITEAMLFAGLLSAYFFLWASSRHWPQGGLEPPELGRISIFTALLLGSSIPIFIAERANARGNVRVIRAMLALSFLMGLSFFINQLIEYRELTYGWRDNAYASAFYTITGLHGLHVFIGLVMSLAVQSKAWTNRLASHDDITVEVYSLYWHFVDAVWIFVFTTLYISPHFAR